MKTLRKHFGKITIAVLISIAFVLIILTVMIPPREVQAATYPSVTISLPTYNSGVLLTKPYFILYDVRTGYLVDATTGVPGVATTWANAALDSGHWTGGAVSTITGFPNLIIPALSSGRDYGILMFDATTPAKTDTSIIKGLYNPRANLPYSDNSPTKRGEVMTRTFIE